MPRRTSSRRNRTGATPQPQPHPQPQPVVPATQPATAPDAGRFRVSDELGRGGMGTVRLAEDPRLGRELAIKFLQAVDASAAAQFLEEAQVTAQLQHPNIVPVYDLGEDANGRPWLAMKRIEGESLADVAADWKQTRRLAPEHLHAMLAIFARVCDAVAFAHSRGVIHRDIKPHNVMVGTFGEVLLVDWGLARPLDRSASAARPVRTARRASGADVTMAGDVFGTPAYMPPEQANGDVDAVDERADIFSLGGLLYWMLTGQPPYKGRNATTTVALAAGHELVPPRRRAPARAIPRELQAIVLKAMAADPAARYRSVAELQTDLVAWQSFRRTTAWRPGPVERVVKWTRRNPTTSIAAALIVVAGLAVTTLLAELRASQAAQEVAERDRRDAEQRAAEADAQRDRIRTRVHGLLDRETRASLDRFSKAADEASAAGLDDFEFGSRLTKDEVAEYLNAHEVLFGFYRDTGEEPEPEAHCARALIRLISGDANGALEDYNAALRIDPRFFPALLNRPHALMELDRHDDAVAALDDLLEAFPDRPDVWIERGNCLRIMRQFQASLEAYERAIEVFKPLAPGKIPTSALRGRGWCYLHLGRTDDAERDFVHVIRGGHPSLDAWTGLASARNKAKRYDDSVKAWSEALRLRQDDPYLWYSRGLDRSRTGDLRGAIDDLNRALELDPQAANAWHQRGHCRRDLGELDGALADLNRSIELDPSGAVAHTCRADIRAKLGVPQGALADYATAMRLDPDLLDARYGRGLLLDDLGEHRAAVDDFDAVLAIDPDYHDVRHSRGMTRMALGDLAGSIRDLAAVAAARPSARVWCALGAAHDQNGNARGAIDGYNAALAIDPDFAPALQNRARWHARQRDPASALRDLDRVLDRDPTDVAALALRGGIHTMVRNDEQAFRDLNEALRLDPDNSVARFNRALILQTTGQAQAAMDDYNRLLQVAPRHASGWANKASIHQAWNQRAEALAAYQNAWRVETNPTNKARWASFIRELGGQVPD